MICKKKLALLALIPVLIAGTYYLWTTKKASQHTSPTLTTLAPTITAKILKKHIEAKKDNIALINVLDKKYHADCHIKGSINIPLDKLKAQTSSWKKDRYIVVYCATAQCSASQSSADILIKLGFTNVHKYKGGTKEWKSLGTKNGFICVGPCQESYLK